MYVDDWTTVKGVEVKAFLNQHNAIDGKYKTSPKTTEVAWHSMPFYEKAMLIRLRDAAWPRDLNIYYLEMPGKKSYRLDGKAAPIQMVNSAAPLKLTPKNVLEYLRWYNFFVRGVEGPFLIAEQMHDPYMPQALDAKTRARMACIVRSAMYEGRNEEGEFFGNAVVFYANGLFLAHFKVDPGGIVAMLDDEQMATDLSVRANAPIA